MNLHRDKLLQVFDHAFASISEVCEAFDPDIIPREVGVTTQVSAGVCRIKGLPQVGFGELLRFSDSLFGIAFNLDPEEIGVILLGDPHTLHTGDEVERTGRVVDVPVGNEVLGRVIHPLGRPLDGKGEILSRKRYPVNRPAPGILDRAPVNRPLQTGVKVIDTMVPIGRGQRELILGDRQTGKTALAVDAILNQKDEDVICVYCAIGQRAASVAKVVATLEAHGAMAYTTVVVTEGNDPPGLLYIAPYAATSIAEYYMEQGKDVLIIYDDLTHHAWAYRELSLLLRRPPGREAFPGDIFYIHARMLERATHLHENLGGGSLTALPIIETEAQNISAYIPTNLISITDGQIFLSPRLFELGILPAVDISKSVSRVGGKAQKPIFKGISGNLKLLYAQFEELESFARFGTHLDEHTRSLLNQGQRIRECLKQAQYQPLSLEEQLGILIALTQGLFTPVPLEKMAEAQEVIKNRIHLLPKALIQRLKAAPKYKAEDHEELIAAFEEALRPLHNPDEITSNP